jgi:hypothetical protein
MIDLVGSTFSNLILEDLFFYVLQEKNPIVLEGILTEI